MRGIAAGMRNTLFAGYRINRLRAKRGQPVL